MKSQRPVINLLHLIGDMIALPIRLVLDGIDLMFDD